MNTAKPQFDYQNFDLLIEASGSGYLARVTGSPAGEAAAKFRLPFSALELENFLLKIGRPRRGVRRLNSPEMDAAKVFGRRLFESVFGSEVFGCLRSSLDQTAAAGSAGLRLRLRLNAPELADLPWEYLYNPALNRFLVLAVETPLVRYIELPERIRPLGVQPPLKILVMLSAPVDYPPLNVEEEWRKLRQALAHLEKRGLVAVERLDGATLPALQRRLRQSSYHIFHFIGHGGYDESAHDGVLLLEDETRHSRKVSGQFLGTILHNHRPLRLAVLNACEGARASRTDPFTGTAQSLVQQGLPAVIAMQFEITDAAAITFSHEFYAALADGYPVDAGLVEARTAIFADGNDVEWGTPVLYMRAPDGKIFDLDGAPQPAPEIPKPKAAPITPPPVRETPKPKETSVPPPQKPSGPSRRPLLVAGIVLTLAVFVWLIYNNIDWSQSPRQGKPADKTRLSAADSLYTQYRNEGNALYQQKKYTEARDKFDAALQQKPNDGYATARKQACNERLAEQQKSYETYKAAGDRLFKQTEYARAKDQYEQALSYRDNDSYLTRQIKECDRLLLAAKRPPEVTPVIGAPTDMVRIPAGSFIMGDNNSNQDDEKPEQQIYVDAFYMDIYEVTVAKFKAFVDATGYKTDAEKNNDTKNWRHDVNGEIIGNERMNHPVIRVSWNDAQAYAKWAKKRLPTEAEWEYASRGGFSGIGGKPQYEYPWGNELSHERANYSGKEGKDQWDGTSPVGAFAPNSFELYDMAGNVWEWCSSLYTPYPYRRDDGRENLTASGQRVLRGGSWGNSTDDVRCAYRDWLMPADRDNYVGFRCVQDAR